MIGAAIDAVDSVGSVAEEEGNGVTVHTELHYHHNNNYGARNPYIHISLNNHVVLVWLQ